VETTTTAKSNRPGPSRSTAPDEKPAEKPSSVFPPASIRGQAPSIPPEEVHSSVTSTDGTRLFLRTKPALNEAELRAGVQDASSHPPTIVFCDGIVCDGFIWKYLWSDLSPARDVTLAHFHYRGHGRSASPADPNNISIGAHAEDVWTVREQLGAGPAILIGHSMGCQVALEAYHRHPENVRGIVLICGSYGNVTKTIKGVPVVDMILPKLISIAEKSPEWVRAIWSRLPSDMALKMALRSGEIDPERVLPEDILPYLNHIKHVDFGLFLRMLHAAGAHTAEDYLSEIPIPVLVIAGEKDTLTPPFLSQAMAAALPNAELLMVEHGTHVAALEQPELVGKKIRAFVEACLA
jgi:pimeloyl-ACP methyl ester carboxylesterase